MGEQFTLSEVHDLGFEQKWAELIKLDIEELLHHKDKFRGSPCPACTSSGVGVEFTHQGFEYVRCATCRTLFISPCPTDELLEEHIYSSKAWEFWRDQMPARIRESRLKMYEERADYIVDVFRRLDARVSTLLEIGAGNGELGVCLSRKSDIARIILSEPQPIGLTAPRVEQVQAPMSRLTFAEPMDAVVAFEVLEHILKPDQFLAKCRELMVPGGLFILSTPNIEGFEARVLGKLSSTVYFDHIRLYNPTALRILMERNGFEVVEISTPGKLDLEMVKRQVEGGAIDCSSDPAVSFLVGDGYQLKDQFQAHLVNTRQSSHMRCVARAKA